MTLAMPHFQKIFKGSCHMSGLSLGTCLTNLKSVVSTILEVLLLAFNAPKFWGSRDPNHAPFSTNF